MKFIKKIKRKVLSYYPRRILSSSHIYIKNNTVLNLRNIRLEKATISLVIIGAGKSGTTSLHYALSQHNDIHMSNPKKEPRYFLNKNRMQDYYSKRGFVINSYDVLFSRFMMKGYRGQPVIGEASTEYTAEREKNVEIAQNIKNHNPNMRIVYILRNPHHRICSHFRQDLKKGRVKEDNLFTYMSNNIEPKIMQSLYYFQLENYLSVFDPMQIKIIILEEFIKNPLENLNELFTFVGLNTMDVGELDFPYYNKSPEVYNGIVEKVYVENFLNQANSFIEEDVKKLELFLGRSLVEWDIYSPFTMKTYKTMLKNQSVYSGPQKWDNMVK